MNIKIQKLGKRRTLWTMMNPSNREIISGVKIKHAYKASENQPCFQYRLNPFRAALTFLDISNINSSIVIALLYMRDLGMQHSLTIRTTRDDVY